LLSLFVRILHTTLTPAVQRFLLTVTPFIPADSAPSVDDLNAIEVSFSKSGETAVAGVAEAKAEVAAPVKVLGANGIQIGNYNIAGQRVK